MRHKCTYKCTYKDGNTTITFEHTKLPQNIPCHAMISVPINISTGDGAKQVDASCVLVKSEVGESTTPGEVDTRKNNFAMVDRNIIIVK